MSKRIAVVDDTPEVAELLRDVLTAAGYDVTTLSGEGDILSDLASARPDLIVLDLLFPGPSSQLDGWEYLQLIRRHRSLQAVPVLVCSADIVGLRRRQDELAADPLLVAVAKPFSLLELEEAVLRLLGADRIPAWDDERDLVLVADGDARLVHASVAMLGVLGLAAEELRGRRVADIVAQTAEWTDREWRSYLAAKTWTGDVTLCTARGARVPAKARADVIEADSSTWHISRIELTERELPVTTESDDRRRVTTSAQ